MHDDEPPLERLFEATRVVERGPNANHDRLRESVAARLAGTGLFVGATVVAGNATATASVGAKVTTLLSGAYAKVAMGVATLAVAATGTLVLRHASPEPPRVLPAAPFVSHPTKLAPMTTPLTATAPQLETAQPAATVASTVTSSTTGTARALVSAAKPPKDSLADELELVRAAQGELRSQQPTQALTLLERYFRSYPRGMLVPEARATRVKALCLAGRTTEAAEEATRFVRAYPKSPLVARVGSVCAAP